MLCDGFLRVCTGTARWVWSYRCARGHPARRYRCEACHACEQAYRLFRRVPACSRTCPAPAIMISARSLEVTP